MARILAWLMTLLQGKKPPAHLLVRNGNSWTWATVSRSCCGTQRRCSFASMKLSPQKCVKSIVSRMSHDLKVDLSNDTGAAREPLEQKEMIREIE